MERGRYRINLCGVGLKGFTNVDISTKADRRINLERWLLPYEDGTVNSLICMSAINYFTPKRAQKIINDVYRVLDYDGVCRFGVQDLYKICSGYVMKDPQFSCERINAWFGLTDDFKASGKTCKYVYDYETLSKMFYKYSFISKKLEYGETYFNYGLERYDNRPEQMFFIEAHK